LEGEKLKAADTKLEKPTMEWLQAQEDLKKLGEEASKHVDESKETKKDFRRVNRILADVRSELVSSQKSWVTSKQKIEEQEMLEGEKLKAADTKLEKPTMEWLQAQEDLKKLGEEASKHVDESKETKKDFRRVNRILADVRSELVSSQKSWVTSKQKIEEQEMVLEKQQLKLDDQQETTVSYMSSLKSAQLEIESERGKLRVIEALNKEFELDLSLKRGLLQNLLGELESNQ
ncbi:hypothetical protein SOVF_086150, partial [Spinacia oleracea]